MIGPSQHLFGCTWPAWKLLMEDRFKELRNTLCRDSDELSHFRQLVINSIMATDLGDKEMKELRNKRWDKAFAEAADTTYNLEDLIRVGSMPQKEPSLDCVNRKATIVIEHLIQAADVAHTMQHWQ